MSKDETVQASNDNYSFRDAANDNASLITSVTKDLGTYFETAKSDSENIEIALEGITQEIQEDGRRIDDTNSLLKTSIEVQNKILAEIGVLNGTVTGLSSDLPGLMERYGGGGNDVATSLVTSVAGVGAAAAGIAALPTILAGVLAAGLATAVVVGISKLTNNFGEGDNPEKRQKNIHQGFQDIDKHQTWGEFLSFKSLWGAKEMASDINKRIDADPNSNRNNPTPDSGPGGDVTVPPYNGGTQQLNPAQAASLIKSVGGTDDEARVLGAITVPESSGINTKHNTKAPDDSYGLWQINMIGKLGPERLKQFGLSSPDELYDPQKNAKAALAIARGPGGFNNWSTYKSGAYRQYMTQSQAGTHAGGAPPPPPALTAAQTALTHTGSGGAPATQTYAQIASTPSVSTVGTNKDAAPLGKSGDLQRFNRAPNGAAGVAGLKPDYAAKLLSFLSDAQNSGHSINIKSGYRTPEHQAELFQAEVIKRGSVAAARKWVAPPGKSNHNKGLAADLGFDSAQSQSWAHENAGKHGLYFRMGYEPWHIEATGTNDDKDTSGTGGDATPISGNNPANDPAAEGGGSPYAAGEEGNASSIGQSHMGGRIGALMGLASGVAGLMQSMPSTRGVPPMPNIPTTIAAPQQSAMNNTLPASASNGLVDNNHEWTHNKNAGPDHSFVEDLVKLLPNLVHHAFG